MSVGMRQPLLFLDFDGVLHPKYEGSFAQLPMLCAWLERYPQVAVVVSSDWRLRDGLMDLMALFPSPLRSRVLGVTPDLRGARAGCDFRYARQCEIEYYRWRVGHDGPFVALDDTAHLFEAQYPALVEVDGASGLTREDLAVANVRLMQQGFRASTEVTEGTEDLELLEASSA